jgi:hypothetical protein
MTILDKKNYCTCEPKTSTKFRASLTKSLCIKCGLPIKIYLQYTITDEDMLALCVTKHKIVTATLVNGVNEVIYNNITYPVCEKSIQVKGTKSIYDLDYFTHRTHYSNPQGFICNMIGKRPFKSGEIRGYITSKKEFYITGYVKKKKDTDVERI